MNKNCGIYKITSPSGKIYIGQSSNIKNRIYSYKKLHCKKQTFLYNSFLKYGVENHQFDIIEYCSEEDLNCSERFWQDEFNVIGKNGLNCILQECGEKRYIISEETRKKISESLKGDKHPQYGKVGELCPNFGRKASDETRRKQSESRKLIPSQKRSDKSKEKCRQSKLGEKNPMYKKTGKEHPRSKIVLCLQNGIYYESLKDACTALKLNYESTFNTVSKNKSFILVFIDNFSDKIVIEKKQVKDIVSGKLYKSITEASKSIGIYRSTLSKMLNGKIENNTNLVII